MHDRDNLLQRHHTSRLPTRFRPGHRLRADEMDALLEASRQARMGRRNQPHRYEAHLDAVRGYNYSDSMGVVDRFECVRLSSLTAYAPPIIVRFNEPGVADAGIAPQILGITLQPIEFAAVGWLQVGGIALVKAGTGSPAVGEEVGPAGGGYGLKKIAGGGLRLMQSAVDIDGEDHWLVRWSHPHSPPGEPAATEGVPWTWSEANRAHNRGVGFFVLTQSTPPMKRFLTYDSEGHLWSVGPQVAE